MQTLLPAVAVGVTLAMHAGPALSPQAAALITPVHAAFDRVRTEQAREGPARTVSDRLVRLGQFDRAGRDVVQKVDLSSLPPSNREAAATVAWAEIDRQDAVDRAALDALLPRRGWFTHCGRG